MSPGRRCTPTDSFGTSLRISALTAAGSPSAASAIRPALVDSSATPMTREPKSSGCRSAKAMIVIPPMLCPTSSTGPAGTRSPSTR